MVQIKKKNRIQILKNNNKPLKITYYPTTAIPIDKKTNAENEKHEYYFERMNGT